jgi:hypothetical protein
MGCGMASGGAFQLRFTGLAGQPFTILVTNDLSAPLSTWPVLTNGTIDGSGSVTLTDSAAATNRSLFYRITSP